MSSRTASGQGVEATVTRDPTTGKVTVVGRISLLGPVAQTIEWCAAAPVTRGIGFAGAGQPYPNKHIAMEGTPHKGVVDSHDGSFTITLSDIPAGYYSGLGTLYIPPSVEFKVTDKAVKHRVSQTVLMICETAVPFRWLNGSPATQRMDPNTETSTGRAMFYGGREDLPIPTSQEALLRARSYPGDMTGRGWPEADDSKPWTNIPAPA